jgi:hypothetical protein
LFPTLVEESQKGIYQRVAVDIRVTPVQWQIRAIKRHRQRQEKALNYNDLSGDQGPS